MAVLVEGISVIIRRKVIKEKFPGKMGELNANVAADAFDYVSSKYVQG